MSEFVYFRNKKTGKVSRAIAYPYMGQNSQFEPVAEEEFLGGAKKGVTKRKKTAKKPVGPPVEPPVEDATDGSAIPSDNDDLMAGLEYGEDGR